MGGVGYEDFGGSCELFWTVFVSQGFVAALKVSLDGQSYSQGVAYTIVGPAVATEASTMLITVKADESPSITNLTIYRVDEWQQRVLEYDSAVYNVTISADKGLQLKSGTATQMSGGQAHFAVC